MPLVDPQPLPDAVLEQWQALTIWQDCLHHIAPRYERVLRLYFGIGCEPHTLAQIGAQYNVGVERVRQILEGAKRRLRSKNKMAMREVFTTLTGQHLAPIKEHTTYTLPPLTTEYQRQLQTYWAEAAIEDISDEEYNELMTEYECGLLNLTSATERTRAILRLGIKAR
jgi:hypothetical protein